MLYCIIPIQIYEVFLEKYTVVYKENLVCQPAFLEMVAGFFKR